MISSHSRGLIVVLGSLVTAFILTVIPLPAWLGLLRPEWVALTLIYWCMALPNRIGVGVAWTTGLFLDVLRGGLLGQHALSLCIIAYITLKLYQRIRVAPLWQQAFSILVLVVLHQLMNLWVRGITGQPPQSWTYWLPSFSSMLIWPLCFIILRELRRHFRIS
jgi:rod shape-determining protein MreD